jgi:uncharacterized OB-fold protein
MSGFAAATRRPLPVPTPVSAPYWAALRAHRIEVQYSPSTGQWVFYPRELAPGSLADDLQWRPISGLGTLYTWSLATRPVSPHFAADVSRLLAVVEWDEGPRVTTELVDCDPARLQIGMRVEPVFHDLTDPVTAAPLTLLHYRPSSR